MKKVYLVTVEEYGYDEFDSMVVIANDEQEAINLCKCEDYENVEDSWLADGFVKTQGKIIATEIDLTKNSQIILKSFNAG